MTRTTTVALALALFSAGALAQTDAVLLKSTDGTTDVPRLVVTTSASASSPASVRVENAALQVGTNSVLRLGTTTPSTPVSGDVRYDAGNVFVYDGSAWQTLLHSGSTLNADNLGTGTVPAARLSGSYTGITGVGVLTTGRWGAIPVEPLFGGTGQSSVAAGDLLYGSAANVWSRLAIGGANTFLKSGGSSPSWGVLAASDVSSFAFTQGGNSFGAPAILGTNDTQSLSFRTSGASRMSIASGGNASIGTVAPGTDRLYTQGYTSDASAVRGTMESGGTIYAEGRLGAYAPAGMPILSGRDAGILGIKRNAGGDGAAAYAWNNDAGTTNFGLLSYADGASTTNYGVYTEARNSTTATVGVFGLADGASGSNSAFSGQAGSLLSSSTSFGLRAFVDSSATKYGAYLDVGNTGSAGTGYGVRTVVDGTAAKYGVYADVGSTGTTGTAFGVYTDVDSSDATACGGCFTATTNAPAGVENYGVQGTANGTSSVNFGVYGTATSSGFGVYGRMANGSGDPNYGLYGLAGDDTSSSVAYGIGTAARGTSTKYAAHLQAGSSGTGGTAYGAFIEADGTALKVGVRAHAGETSETGAAYGVQGYGLSSDSNTYGGYFFAQTSPGATAYGAYAYGDNYDFYAAGPGVDYGSSSSIRWKRDIRPIDEPLAKVLALRGVTYRWDEEHGGGPDLGMIAEEVGRIVPEIVGYEPNGVDAVAVDYGRLTPLLVEALKTLERESDERAARQQAEIDELRRRLERLEKRP